MSSRTGAIHGRYSVPPHGSGIMYFPPDELTAITRELDPRGLQVCIHAQEDRAIEAALDAYATAAASRPRTRSGTVSSTAARCIRRSRPGRRSWGS